MHQNVVILREASIWINFQKIDCFGWWLIRKTVVSHPICHPLHHLSTHPVVSLFLWRLLDTAGDDPQFARWNPRWWKAVYPSARIPTNRIGKSTTHQTLTTHTCHYFSKNIAIAVPLRKDLCCAHAVEWPATISHRCRRLLRLIPRCYSIIICSIPATGKSRTTAGSGPCWWFWTVLD